MSRSSRIWKISICVCSSDNGVKWLHLSLSYLYPLQYYLEGLPLIKGYLFPYTLNLSFAVRLALSSKMQWYWSVSVLILDPRTAYFHFPNLSFYHVNQIGLFREGWETTCTRTETSQLAQLKCATCRRAYPKATKVNFLTHIWPPMSQKSSWDSMHTYTQHICIYTYRCIGHVYIHTYLHTYSENTWNNMQVEKVIIQIASTH